VSRGFSRDHRPAALIGASAPEASRHASQKKIARIEIRAI